jgi:hypothetical protein
LADTIGRALKSNGFVAFIDGHGGGPEYLALLEATKNVDPDSKDGQEIVSMFVTLDESCPH